MGGGDLNTKKTWHPSTLKNQERVWKAEQAAAQEKKRIAELERERAQERDREELNALSKRNSAAEPSDNRLHWMYDKPDKKIQHEDYLLGKAIDKNFDQPGKSDQNEIPAVSRRVVGSSMITAGDNSQVDLARKLREDPLLLVKEREREARAALLNNPIQRRRLAELLRKEQEQKKILKGEKKSKKKDKSLDNLLAAKLNALGGEKGMNIAKLLESDDSSSESSSDEEVKQKKKKKKKKKQKKKKSKKCDNDSDVDLPRKSKKKIHESKASSEESDREYDAKNKKSYHNSKYVSSKDSSLKRKVKDASSDDERFSSKKNKRDLSPNIERKKDRNESSKDSSKRRTREASSDDDRISYKKNRKDYSPKRNKEMEKHKVYHDSSDDRSKARNDKSKYDYGKNQRRNDESDRRHKPETKKTGLSEEEKAARLAAMAAAGAEREVQRGRRVAEQRAEIDAAEKVVTRHSSRNEARVLPDSLESRIHSNRHNIQRDQRHMNEHFAKR